jgi:putative hydrolase of the HAD superfamily
VTTSGQATYRALLLDALGTLVSLEPPPPILRAELAARLGIEVTSEQAARAIAMEIAYYRAHLDEGVDAVRLAALRRRCAEVLREALPASAALRSVDANALTEVLLASLRFSAYPDARPAIVAARERGLRVVVASNWDISLNDLLARLELTPLLDGIVTSAEVGARKPAPPVFERALELAQCRPEDAIHVGDSIHEDVAGARAVGIEAVLLSRRRREAPPEVRTIESLEELDRIAP